jgi:hypothetical protein
MDKREVGGRCDAQEPAGAFRGAIDLPSSVLDGGKAPIDFDRAARAGGRKQFNKKALHGRLR